MSGQEPPALWEESLDGQSAWDLTEDQLMQITLWLNELWERHKDDIPWTDSPSGPE